MSRSKRANIAKVTIEIVERGWYEFDDGRRIEIREQVAVCRAATVLVRPGGHEGSSDWGAAPAVDAGAVKDNEPAKIESLARLPDIHRLIERFRGACLQTWRAKT
jgi:hypothetical protein